MAFDRALTKRILTVAGVGALLALGGMAFHRWWTRPGAGPHAGRGAAERTGHLRRTGRRLLPRRRWRARPYPGRDTRAQHVDGVERGQRSPVGLAGARIGGSVRPTEDRRFLRSRKGSGRHARAARKAEAAIWFPPGEPDGPAGLD